MKWLLLFVAFSFPLQVAAEWQPAQNPDPHAILDEVENDIQASRFQDALAKLLWFHHHALDHRPLIGGVRLSYALDMWHHLGKVYPPAMTKLIETRDAAAKQVLEGKDELRQAFHDMASINREIGDNAHMVSVFATLDKENPKGAESVYSIAQNSLVEAKEYTLCGRYLRPTEELEHLLRIYHFQLDRAKEQGPVADKRGDRKSAEASFMREAATLIAILVLNDRSQEAQAIAERVRCESKFRERDNIVEAALRGEIPDWLTDGVR